MTCNHNCNQGRTCTCINDNNTLLDQLQAQINALRADSDEITRLREENERYRDQNAWLMDEVRRLKCGNTQ